MKKQLNIVWLKRDLRTRDHRPFQEAEAAGAQHGEDDARDREDGGEPTGAPGEPRDERVEQGAREPRASPRRPPTRSR